MDKTERTIRLTERDHQAIATIREQYGLTSDSEAIRFALHILAREIRQQRLSDAPAPNYERSHH